MDIFQINLLQKNCDLAEKTEGKQKETRVWPSKNVN